MSPKQTFSGIFHDRIAASKVTHSANRQGSILTGVILCCISGVALWAVSFAPQLHKPQIVGNPTLAQQQQLQLQGTKYSQLLVGLRVEIRHFS